MSRMEGKKNGKNGPSESAWKAEPIGGLVKLIIENAYQTVIDTVSGYDAEELKKELISWLEGIKKSWDEDQAKKSSP